MVKPYPNTKILGSTVMLTNEVLKNVNYFYLTLESFPVIKIENNNEEESSILYLHLLNNETFDVPVMIRDIPTHFAISFVTSVMHNNIYLKKFVEAYKIDLDKLDIPDELKIYIRNLLDTFEESYEKYEVIGVTTDSKNYMIIGIFGKKLPGHSSSLQLNSIKWTLKKMFKNMDKDTRNLFIETIKKQIEVDLNLYRNYYIQ